MLCTDTAHGQRGQKLIQAEAIDELISSLGQKAHLAKGKAKSDVHGSCDKIKIFTVFIEHRPLDFRSENIWNERVWLHIYR